MNPDTSPKVVIHTHGCKLNQADSQVLARQFQQAGFTVVRSAAQADVVVLNSCTVTANSDSKARQYLRRARRNNPNALVVATGCYAQRAKDDLSAMEAVSLVLDNRDKPTLVSTIATKLNVVVGSSVQNQPVVVGRSLIVVRPISLMLYLNGPGGDATVTVCHSRTRDIAAVTREADIIVAAMGMPHFIKADMVREGAVVIDVGINRIEDATAKKGYRIVGDVDFENVAPKASWITPVPGGVGPMTVAMLMANTYRALEMRG